MQDVEEFRAEVRGWLADNLVGEFSALKGLGGPGREHEAFEERRTWNQHLAAAGLTCLGWPVKHGGRGFSTAHRVAFYEEYARADAPDKVNHFGEELLGPTLIAFGTQEQQQRFLPRILDVTELWCQGYSEPGAGSDLANVSTTAELDGDQWVINGQKVWTSLAHLSQWCFVVARTEKGSKRHAGLSYLLVPLDQPGVQIRPIVQITGTAEFNEVFFDDARTDASLVVGQPGDGWRVAMGTLTFERGVLLIGVEIDCGFSGNVRGFRIPVALGRHFPSMQMDYGPNRGVYLPPRHGDDGRWAGSETVAARSPTPLTCQRRFGFPKWGPARTILFPSSAWASNRDALCIRSAAWADGSKESASSNRVDLAGARSAGQPAGSEAGRRTGSACSDQAPGAKPLSAAPSEHPVGQRP